MFQSCIYSLFLKYLLLKIKNFSYFDETDLLKLGSVFYGIIGKPTRHYFRSWPTTKNSCSAENWECDGGDDDDTMMPQ